MPRDKDPLVENKEDYCPNCGQYTGGNGSCPNCGAILDTDADEFDGFHEAEEDVDDDDLDDKDVV